MMNCVNIMGRLTKDPELRHIGDGVSVVSFTIACDEDFVKDGERATDFIDCTAWRQNAEFICKNFTKGRVIALQGRLKVRNWTDKEGNRRRNTEVIVENAYFADSKRSNDNKNDGNEECGQLPYDED